MEKPPQRIMLDVSWTALLKVLALLAGIWAVVALREVVGLLLVVFIFVAAVNPTILLFQRKMSRALAVSLFFTILLLITAGIVYVFVPLLLHQIKELGTTYPMLAERIQPYLGEGQFGGSGKILEHFTTSLTSALDSFSNDVVERSASLINGLVTFVTGLVISFYLLLEERNAKDFFTQVLPRHRFAAVYVTVQRISEKMGHWIRGQVLLMVLVTVANLVSYLIIGIPTPVPLAIWAGFCEVIPYIGPLLGMLPAILIALGTGSVIKALLVFAISFGVIQQIESHYAVPKIMGKAIGLSPVLVIIAIVIGLKLFGVVGALIAVPAAAGILVVVQEWPQLRKIWEEGEQPEAV